MRRRPIVMLVLAAMLGGGAAGAAPLPLIPMPRSVAASPGRFTVTDGTPLVCRSGGADCRWVAGYLAHLVAQTRGLTLPQGWEGRRRAIVLRMDAPVKGRESYRLDVTPRGIVIAASSRAGLFYGAVTLWQLLTATPGGGAAAIPAVRIADSPRFSWRGLMLDSVRHFQPPPFIKSFIDAMALHKLNVLQWHLTDDQGWRLQIRRYPRLTAIGAWRVPAGAGAKDIDPATGKPRLYGGFYTQDDVRGIVAYAKARNVTIVPEIEMPGHATAAIVAYPALGAAAAPPRAVPERWGVFDNLYNVDDSTFTFLENVLTEVMALFPGRFIHVGGDEAVKDQWKASKEVQARMTALGIANADALQGYFTARIGKFLAAHGRRLMGWDEILQGGVPPDAAITSWRGIDGAVAAAKAGHDAVLAPAPTLYFDNRQAEGPDEPPGRGAIVSLKDVYDFNPAPAALTPDQQRHILGLEATIWTEHIRTADRVDYAAFPRAAALAERGWSPAADWDSFRARLPVQFARYRALGLPHSESALAVPAPPPPDRRDSHQMKLCGNALPLSVEDDAPLHGHRAVFLVDIMNPCWIYTAADLTGVTALSAGVGQVPFNYEIGDDVKKIPLPPPATPDGALVVRRDDCAGPVVATLPLAPAVHNDAVTTLRAPVAPQSGVHDLCLTFTRRSLDPMWVIDWLALDRTKGQP